MSVVTDYRNSGNYDKGRPAGPPASITIHHWGIDGQDHDAVTAYLARKGGDTSAHYVVSAGRVTCLVDPDHRAWHAGPKGNPRSIGIECRPECSPGDMITVATLIAELRARYGDLPLIPHSSWKPTACPGRWTSKISDLDAMARRYARTPEPLTALPTHTPTDKEIAVKIIKTTTPWGSEATARLHPLNGATALTGQAAASAEATYGATVLPWDWWNLEVRTAWEDHATYLRSLGKEVTETVEEATQKIVNAVKEAEK